MKLTEKTKKYLAIGGGAVICIALVAAIGMRFAKAPAQDDALPESSSSETQIVVDPSNLSHDATDDSTENDLVIRPNTDSVDDGQAVDSRPAQTDEGEQSIQPDVTKPEQPSEDVLTDPTAMPDGTPVEQPPVAVDHDTYTPPEDTDTQNSGGGLPGFDNVQNGGDNQVIEAPDMYENGNKIGSMD